MELIKPILAFMYDFDKTLSPKDMQEFTFLPNLGINDPDDFWKETSKIAVDGNMSTVSAYMYLMLKKSREKGIRITRQSFVSIGKDVELFKGVDTWFKRINNYAKEKGAVVEHYIISSGIKEIIEGTSISNEFKEIYASSYYYEENGVAAWPAFAIDFSSKTQCLFRINKGFLSLNDNRVNNYVKETDRRIPFKNMIYIGDGFTDVPCMKLVKVNGGQSVVVYKPNSKKSEDNAKKLFNDDRVCFLTSADYSEGKEMEQIAFKVIDKIKVDNEIEKIYRNIDEYM